MTQWEVSMAHLLWMRKDPHMEVPSHHLSVILPSSVRVVVVKPVSMVGRRNEPECQLTKRLSHQE